MLQELFCGIVLFVAIGGMVIVALFLLVAFAEMLDRWVPKLKSKRNS